MSARWAPTARPSHDEAPTSITQPGRASKRHHFLWGSAAAAKPEAFACTVVPCAGVGDSGDFSELRLSTYTERPARRNPMESSSCWVGLLHGARWEPRRRMPFTDPVSAICLPSEVSKRKQRLRRG
uniref:Uncharacterized protein n=1 Tax=Zooxanthella nutricula TaxID=1333877 RepID=A0A7S2PCR1_9DINO